MKKINVLSLFDGMSCGQLAISQLGFEYNYYASEIDKHAMQVTQSNFPNTVQLGSVEHWQLWDLDFASIDLLIGGSPCQGFSFAGKQLNFDDPRSRLFFVYVDILNYIRSVNPNVKFLLENVKMKKEYEAVISEHLGVKPIEINSNLVSAQNRKRLYWTNIEGVTQPEDRGIYLKDILQEDVDEKYYLSDKSFEKQMYGVRSRLVGDTSDKIGTLMANQAKQSSDMLCVAGEFKANYLQVTGGFDSDNRFCYPEGKHRTLTASGRDKTGVLLSDAQIGREAACLSPKRTEYGKQIRKEYEAGIVTEQRKNIQQLEPRNEGKTNCLTTVQKDNLVMSGYKICRLTPIECERLQTVPDNYTASASDTQRYRMLGNGWTVEVIKHILKNLKA